MIERHLNMKALSRTFVWTAVFVLAFKVQAVAQITGDPGVGGVGNVGTGNTAATSFGDMICNVVVNTSAFAWLFEWGAYVLGATLGAMGIHHFRLHSENPGNNPLSRPVMMWFGAACLLALPEAAGTVIDTIYGGAQTDGSISCVAVNATTAAASLDEMMVNFVKNIKKPLLRFASIVAIAGGLLMIIRGLNKAARYGFDPKANSAHSILTNIIFGALLMTIGDNLDMVMDSVFGTPDVGGSSAISWSLANQLAGGASAQFKATVIACLTFVQVVGGIAFVRGWFILKKAVENGQQGIAQGFTHVIGGVLAINIYSFLKIMDTTFGTGLL